MDAMIRMVGVTKNYGSQAALDRVSFEVPRGVVFALLGENGAGKSTCIRVLLGLAQPSAGHAEVMGLNSQTQSLEIRRTIGYVAERPTLYEWMTVRESGEFTSAFYGGDFQRRYAESIERYQLPMEKKLKSLSKGMRAKVVLALALAHDPELLVLDEPTSGLDTLVRRDFLESMVDRAATGKTVFLSSHQINEVERVADIVAILKQGKLIAVERLEKLKAETVELTVTLSEPSGEPPLVQGELLRERRRSRQWQLLVRKPDPASLERLRTSPIVQSIETRTPSLEEIFVAYMRRNEQAPLEAEQSPVQM